MAYYIRSFTVYTTTTITTTSTDVNCLFQVFSTASQLPAGPTVWNSLSDDLSDPAVESEHFTQNL